MKIKDKETTSRRELIIRLIRKVMAGKMTKVSKTIKIKRRMEAKIIKMAKMMEKAAVMPLISPKEMIRSCNKCI